MCERWVLTRTSSASRGRSSSSTTFGTKTLGPEPLAREPPGLGGKLELLLAESLRVAHRSGALRTKDFFGAGRGCDTTVQPKNVTLGTEPAKLLHAAINGLPRLAKKHGVGLRQSYLRIAKRAAMMAGALCACRNSSTATTASCAFCASSWPDHPRHRRRIAGDAPLEAAFSWPLSRADQIRSQQQRQRGWKLYSFHAPEVECIGRGKASAPYEFGVKASIVTTNARAPGGQFVLHARAMPGNPYDGHTLRDILEDTQRLTGREIERAYADKGYRGHDAANPRRVFISGQKRGVLGHINASSDVAPPSRR